MVGRRSPPAIVVVPPASRTELTPPGEAERLFPVGAFFEAERVAGEVSRRPEHAAGSSPTRRWRRRPGPRYSGPTPPAPGIGGRLQPPGGNEWPRSPPGGARPSGVSTVNRLVWLLLGRSSPGATPSPSPSPGAGSRTLREAVRPSSPSPLSARVRPAGCAARARTEHDAGDGYGSAVAEVYRMPEDPVAFLHPGLIPEHDVRRLRPARVRTSPTPDGAA